MLLFWVHELSAGQFKTGCMKISYFIVFYDDFRDHFKGVFEVWSAFGHVWVSGKGFLVSLEHLYPQSSLESTARRTSEEVPVEK